MIPTLNVGDVVLIEKQNDYAEGDIVTFIPNLDKKAETYIHHFVTKGDNNPGNDMFSLTKGNIVGKMIYKIPKLGNFHLIC